MGLLLLVFLALVVKISSQNCRWTDPVSGTNFDLSPLYKPDAWYSNLTSKYTYDLNVCGIVPSSGCSQKNGLLCQYDGIAFTAMIAGWNVTTSGSGRDAKAYGEWGLIDPTNPATGVLVNFTNGDACVLSNQRYDRIAIMKFYCGTGQPSTFDLLEAPTCTFTSTYYSDAGCPAHDGSSGISGGSIFLIMVVVVVPLYVVIGCIYKSKAQGTAGIESCPNIEFWRDLSGLIKDGFKFLAGGCKKGSGDSYDEL